MKKSFSSTGCIVIPIANRNLRLHCFVLPIGKGHEYSGLSKWNSFFVAHSREALDLAKSQEETLQMEHQRHYKVSKKHVTIK